MNDWPETSESLILRVKDPADAAAWSAFLAIYPPVIYRLARRRGLLDAEAEDLAQQVLVSISRTLKNWKPEADGPPFWAWLYRIAHNDCLKAITRRKPDAAIGSSTVQNMLHNLPQDEAEASVQLLNEVLSVPRSIFRVHNLAGLLRQLSNCESSLGNTEVLGSTSS